MEKLSANTKSPLDDFPGSLAIDVDWRAVFSLIPADEANGPAAAPKEVEGEAWIRVRSVRKLEAKGCANVEFRDLALRDALVHQRAHQVLVLR